MARILFWLLVALAIYVGYRFWRLKQQRELRGHGERPRVEAMVRCEVCGLNLPQSDAVSAGNRWYCGDEHRRRGEGGG